MRSDYTRIFRSEKAAEKYDTVVYAPGTYSASVSARQGNYLRRRLPRWFPGTPPIQHDFACGTGRGIRMLEGLVDAAHGYDTSVAMLERARHAKVQAKLHEISEDGPVQAAGAEAGPALVTMLRFLLNVDQAARDRALAFAAQMLQSPESGLLVVENHGPRHSLRGLSRRRHRSNAWFAEISHAQVTEMLGRHGFQIVERTGFALCPPGAYRIKPIRVAARLVDDVAARLPTGSVATDVLYVARRLP